MKLLGVILNASITWEEHIRTVKTGKTFSKKYWVTLLHNHLIEEKSILSIYFGYI